MIPAPRRTIVVFSHEMSSRRVTVAGPKKQKVSQDGQHAFTSIKKEKVGLRGMHEEKKKAGQRYTQLLSGGYLSYLSVA